MRLQHSIDAGVLAGGSLKQSMYAPQNLVKSEIERRAREVTYKNLIEYGFKEGVEFNQNNDITPTYHEDTLTLDMTARLHPSLLLLRFIPGFGGSYQLSSKATVGFGQFAFLSIVLDVSTSMNDYMNGVVKLTKLKDSAANFIRNLPARTMYSITVFGGVPRTVIPMSHPDWTAAQMAAQQKAALDFINNTNSPSEYLQIEPNSVIKTGAVAGRTNTSGGIYMGWDAMQSVINLQASWQDYPRFELLFTDGAPTTSTANWISTANKVRETPVVGTRPWWWTTKNDETGNPIKNYWYQFNGQDYGFPSDHIYDPTFINSSLPPSDPGYHARNIGPGDSNPAAMSLVWPFNLPLGDMESGPTTVNCYRNNKPGVGPGLLNPNGSVYSNDYSVPGNYQIEGKQNIIWCLKKDLLTEMETIQFRDADGRLYDTGYKWTMPKTSKNPIDASKQWGQGPCPYKYSQYSPGPTSVNQINEQTAPWDPHDPKPYWSCPLWDSANSDLKLLKIPAKSIAVRDSNYTRLPYWTALAAADYVRRQQKVTFFVIGIGDDDPGSGEFQHNPNYFFGDLGDSNKRKDYMLNRLAADPRRIQSPYNFPDFPCDKGDATCALSLKTTPNAVDTYEKLQNDGVRLGRYESVNDINKLPQAFNGFNNLLKLKLQQ